MRVESLVLFSLCIALLFLLIHTQARPVGISTGISTKHAKFPAGQPTFQTKLYLQFDSDLMDNVVAMMHWQTLLAIITLLIMDAQMFEDLATALLGGVLAFVNTVMLLMVRGFRSILARLSGIRLFALQSSADLLVLLFAPAAPRSCSPAA